MLSKVPVGINWTAILKYVLSFSVQMLAEQVQQLKQISGLLSWDRCCVKTKGCILCTVECFCLVLGTKAVLRDYPGLYYEVRISKDFFFVW